MGIKQFGNPDSLELIIEGMVKVMRDACGLAPPTVQ
jgi:hypothetical protein